MPTTLEQLERAYAKLGRITAELHSAQHALNDQVPGSLTRSRAAAHLSAVNAEWNTAYASYVELLDDTPKPVVGEWFKRLQTEPTEQPRYSPPVDDPRVETTYLGAHLAAGTYFDLWHTLAKVPNSVATVYAVHAEPTPARPRYECLVCERAGFYRKHGEYPDIPGWRDGVNLALAEGDKRIKARKLRLSR